MSKSETVIQGVFQGGPPRTMAQATRPTGTPLPLHNAMCKPSCVGVSQPTSNQPTAFTIPHLPPRGLGQSLPRDVQLKMESAFRTDFSDVRIHIGSQAPSIGALAYTQGSDIHFAPGQYNPNTPYGQKLLGHELTHVVQQRAGRVCNPFGAGVAVVQDPALEAEADRMGMRAAAFPTPVQAKMPNKISVLQKMQDYGEELLDEATTAGARLGQKSIQWVNIDTVKRSFLSWFSESIRTKMGIPQKPKPGSKCQMCGKVKHVFELDHMTPWRQYIAALSSSAYIKKIGGVTHVRADEAKALYNDPDNLWWICHDCNNPKSDIIPETASHAAGDFSSGTYGRSGPAPSSFLPQ
ncbi:DUF4157 domain-containing protein [bacterium]|nr:DUF4157 domain-containing protein [bacterium]